MPGISEGLVRELAGFSSAGPPVTSCYLDIDGRRRPHHHDLVESIQHLTRMGRETFDGDRRPAADLAAVEQFVQQGLERSEMRGLAMFSCRQAGLWEAIGLPVSVRDQVTIGPRPAIRQLEAILQQAERVGVLSVDRQRARVTVFRLGSWWWTRRGRSAEEIDDRGERERGTRRATSRISSPGTPARRLRLAFSVHRGMASTGCCSRCHRRFVPQWSERCTPTSESVWPAA